MNAAEIALKRLKILLLVTALWFGWLGADLQDHFKRNFDKPACYLNPMRYIDFIYTINLDPRPEKFASCLEQLSPYGIIPFRFSAVNGWELSLSALNDIGIKYERGMATRM